MSSKYKIPPGITRRHLEAAMAEYRRSGLPKQFRNSHTFDVVDDQERRYPPPAIMGLAIKEMTGRFPDKKIPAYKGSQCFKIILGCDYTIKRKASKAQRQSSDTD